MSTETLEITHPGLLTTVQDLGRYGYQKFGVPVSGAMDEFALRAANILLGNDDGDAVLEITVLGPQIRFLKSTWIAVTGADISLNVDGNAIPQWQSVKVLSGSVLSFGELQHGMRAYLSVNGGIKVPTVMGSRSTYLPAGFGGLHGRALKAGDIINTFNYNTERMFVERRLLDIPHYPSHQTIRVILGPQDQLFPPESIDTFLNSTYSLSTNSDRAGYRFEGPTIKTSSGSDIISDGSPMGAVQIPGDGFPIIMMADRGTTGGYAKIATVIKSDISNLGQLMPDDTVTFKTVTNEEAHKILEEQEGRLRSIIDEPSSCALTVLVDNQVFEVLDDSDCNIVSPKIAPGGYSSELHHVRSTFDDQSYEFDVEVQRKQ